MASNRFVITDQLGQTIWAGAAVLVTDLDDKPLYAGTLQQISASTDLCTVRPVVMCASANALGWYLKYRWNSHVETYSTLVQALVGIDASNFQEDLEDVLRKYRFLHG